MPELNLKAMNDVVTWWETERELPRTEWVRFINDTHDFEVEVFLFEFRQIRNLPPPDGYVEWSGVTVGGTNIDPGQQRISYLQKRVIGHFADAGLLNIRHRPSGRVDRTFNFRDAKAPEGRYFQAKTWAIRQTSGLADAAIEATFEGLLDDGTIIRSE